MHTPVSGAQVESLKRESILQGKHYSLKPLREENICDFYIHWLNDPQVNQFLEVRFVPQTRQTVRDYVGSFYAGVEKYIWGIYPNGQSGFVGTATLSQINRNHGCAEIGLMIGDSSHWGKEASAEALEQVIHFAFDVLKLRRLTGGSYAANLGMNFTFKRSGFRCEGKLVKAYVLKPGQVGDGYRWALLAEEWRACEIK